MSDPIADSAGATGEATGETAGNPAVSDSTPTPEANGQEQGDQSQRVNGLMALANKRLTERNQALQEVEDLKAQLAEASASQDVDQPTQVGLMYPSEPEGAAEPVDPFASRRTVIDPNNAPRPSLQTQRAAAVPYAPTMTPGARYARDRGEIESMKARLNQLGRAWADGQGLAD